MSEVYNSMITGYIIGGIIGLVINGLLAKIPAKMAKEKGYSYGGYWCLSFFFTFITGMLVAASIPDRNIHKKRNEACSNHQNNPSATDQNNYKESCNQDTINNMVIPSKKHIKSLDLGYSLDLAVQITKAELLFDETQDSLYLDLEIYNVSNKVITFLDLSIECYDTVGDKLSDDYIVEHSLIDISTRPQEVFKNTLIKLNDKRIRNIKVNINKLMFKDGEVVRYTGDEKLVQNIMGKKVDDLDDNLFSFFNNYIASELRASVLPIKYFPNANSDVIWTCCCGRNNTLEKDICCLCGRNKVKQINLINEEYIERAYVEQQDLEKKQEKERKRQHEIELKAIKEAERLEEKKQKEAMRLEKEKRAERKKIVAIVTGGTLIVICFMIYLFSSYLPSQKYNKAIILKENNEYDEAIKILDEIVFYKDASTIVVNMRQELKYIDACEFEKKKYYASAILLFHQLDDYKDAKERLKNITYIKKYDDAIIFINEEKYDLALDIYKDVEDKKISNALNEDVKQLVYEKAITLLENKQYIESNEVFSMLGEYHDSPQRIIENKYNHAMILISNGEEISSYLFRELNNYKDFKEQAYNKAKDYVDEKEYSKAISLFNGLGGYNDSRELQKQYIYTYATLLSEQGDLSKSMLLFKEISRYKDAEKKIEDIFINLVNQSKHIISAGDYHTVALRKSGSVVATGANGYRQCDVDYWRDIIAVAAGNNHTVGLKSDGTVVAVGNNDCGQCDVEGWKDIVMISAGYSSTIGLKSDGTIVWAGYGWYGREECIEWKNILSISESNNNTVGLKTNGTVIAIGYDGEGQLNTKKWRDVVAIAAGDYRTVGLKSDGKVVTTEKWYDFDEWQDIVSIEAGVFRVIGLKKDGTVIATKHDGQQVEDWTDIIAISTGKEYTVGVKADGTVVSTGYNNEYGQCDVGEWTNIGAPSK